ncbi:PAS domain-containing protein, partial [Rhizobiaceae sp. 2RAB30]
MTTAFNSLGETGIDAVRALQIIESMAAAAAWETDAAGRFTYITPGAVAFIGTALSDLNSSLDPDVFGWSRVVHPDDYERVAALWRHCVQTGDHYDIELRMRRADGAYIWFQCSGRASRDDRGNITSWHGTTFNIDGQKRVEAALRDRERELSQLVDMVPSHVWRLMPNGEPVFFNKRMVDYLGLDVADLDKPGQSRLDALVGVVHPEDATAFDGTLRRCLATGERFSMRYRMSRADGVYRWMSSRAEPVRAGDGSIVQWYGLCHDIDDQMQAEEAVRRSERQLRRLVDAVPALIWSTTPEGTPSYINKRLIDTVGVTLEDLITPDASRSLADIHPDDRRSVEQALARSVGTGNSFAMSYRQRRADGGYRWTEGRAEPLRNESGDIVQWYG